jgi:hypothetical protein
LLQLAALSRRVCAAVVTSLLAAAFSGSGLLPTMTEAEEAWARPIEHSGVEHALRRPWRTPAGTPSIGLKGQSQTENWAGYISPGQPPFTSVVGRWVVPSVSYAAGNPFSEEASSLWIGIGGADGEDDLIQLGTEQDVWSSGAATYYAWYEMLPEDQISLPQQYPVSPGDVMSASMLCIVSCTAGAAQTWTLSIADHTAGWSWTSNVSYASSLSSAEWILEATASGRGAIQHLPDFGSTVFFADLVNGASPGLALAQAHHGGRYLL